MAEPAPTQVLAPFRRPRLRFMTCGAVDDGKSTLIGRLLYDAAAVFEDHVAEVLRVGEGDLDFSLFVDGLRAEREQGITIDVAHRYFTTARRAFAIADAPGHEQYTGNQAAAASQTDLAVVVVSAADGVQPQTRRHMAIAALFGVRHTVVVVNKMDLAGWRKDAFDACASELADVAETLGLVTVAAIPVCARAGDNVVHRSQAAHWYAGAAVLETIEEFEPQHDGRGGDAVLPIALTQRLPGGGRISFGKLVAGTLATGDRLQAESGTEATVTRLWAAGVETANAAAGEALAVQLSPETDLGRGTVLAHRRIAPVMQARARLVWLGPEPLHVGRIYAIQVGTARAGVTVRPEASIDLRTFAAVAVEDEIAKNDIAVARLTLTAPLPATTFDESRALGAFILVDRVTTQTVGAGVILSIEQRADDLPWHRLQITPADRARLMGQQPLVIWLTGLSGAGKSTIADLLDRRLHRHGRHAIVLDGDNLRHGLSSDLGFTEADRSENVRRVGEVAALMADAGLIVIVALISPFAADRQRARETIGKARFVEVFVDAPLEVCEQRDTKGMYARARQGTLQRFTGVAAAYEPPDTPDVHLRTDGVAPEDAAEALFSTIEARLRR